MSDIHKIIAAYDQTFRIATDADGVETATATAHAAQQFLNKVVAALQPELKEMRHRSIGGGIVSYRADGVLYVVTREDDGEFWVDATCFCSDTKWTKGGLYSLEEARNWIRNHVARRAS